MTTKPRRRRPGRELTERVCQALRVGCPLPVAGTYAGVPADTLDGWVRAGHAGDKLYTEFVQAVDLALAEGRMRDLVRIDKAGDDDWRPLAWKLKQFQADSHPGDGGVVESLTRELARCDQDLATSPLALTALALARELDFPGNSATSKSNCARELRETLDRLRELAPPVREANRVDELRQRRAARRSA